MGCSTQDAEYKYAVLKWKQVSPEVAGFAATYIQSQVAIARVSHRGRAMNDRWGRPPQPQCVALALVILSPQNMCTGSRLKNDIVNSSLGSNLCHHSKEKTASHPCIFPLDQSLSTQLAEEASRPGVSKEFTKIKGKLDADALFN